MMVLTIRRKLIMIISLSFLIVLALGAAMFYVQAQDREYIRIIKTAGDIESCVLKNKIHEIKFFSTLELSEVNDFHANSDKIIEITNKLMKKVGSKEAEEGLKDILSGMEEYRKKFDYNAGLLNERGLGETLGIKGELMIITENIKKLMAGNNDIKLQEKFTLIKRYEKEYMDSGDEAVVSMLENESNIFMEGTPKAELKNEIKSYIEVIAKLKKLNSEINLGMNSLSFISSKIEGKINKIMEMMDKAVVDKQREIQILVLIFILILMVLNLAVSLPMIMSIVKPLDEFSKILTIGAAGELGMRATINTNDEIGLLSREFNNFFIKLDKTIESIKKIIHIVVQENGELAVLMKNIVNGSSGTDKDNGFKEGIIQLEEYIEKIKDNVRSQTASTEESLASLEEMSSSSMHVAEKTKLTLTASERAVEAANEGQGNIKIMADGMQNISISVKATNERIKELMTLSKNIGHITVEINEISEQTNLLALNAAIEAARAGEAGRGFTVVADEIRKLAVKTNMGTEKIAEIIAAIQSEVEIVKLANEKVEANVSEGLDITDKVNKIIREIIISTENSDIEMKNIAMSVEEQREASGEITKAVGIVAANSIEIEELAVVTNEISQKIADMLIKRLDDIKYLMEMTEKLQTDISFFRTSSENKNENEFTEKSMLYKEFEG